jgi:hypothetical protein
MATKSKKIVRREYTKERREGVAGSFESENAGDHDCKADEEVRRFLASEALKLGIGLGHQR